MSASQAAVVNGLPLALPAASSATSITATVQASYARAPDFNSCYLDSSRTLGSTHRTVPGVM